MKNFYGKYKVFKKINLHFNTLLKYKFDKHY